MSGSRLFSLLYDPLMELRENLDSSASPGSPSEYTGRILELGMGTGRNIPLYPPAVEHLFGIDPDEAMLRQARRRAGKASFSVELLLASAEDLPFEEDSFDAVVGLWSFAPYPTRRGLFERCGGCLSAAENFISSNT